jgi:hypothetical protein
MSEHDKPWGSEASLDRHLRDWLSNLSRKWHTPVADVVRLLGWGEIANRTGQYPLIGEILRTSPFHKAELADVLPQCWAMMGRFNSIRLGHFLSNPRSTPVLTKFVRSFPRSDGEARDRIDWFIDWAVELGFKTPLGGNDFAGAALFASVLVTALAPRRFVDFRHGRWSEMAKILGYVLPELETYGEEIVHAGRFAQAVCRTQTFRSYWPDQEPLWALSGICWLGSVPTKPSAKDLPPDFDEETDEETFPEGGTKKAIHRSHERNRQVVKLAKERAWQRDHSLPCEVCEFSFVENYGELGEEFIEAHHRQPVATLKRGNPTRVEDIALVCANCHRMLHAGGTTLSAKELKAIMR